LFSIINLITEEHNKKGFNVEDNHAYHSDDAIAFFKYLQKMKDDDIGLIDEEGET
jgi:hypothetical protein